MKECHLYLSMKPFSLAESCTDSHFPLSKFLLLIFPLPKFNVVFCYVHRWQSSSSNPSLSPFRSSGNNSLRLFQKRIESFDWTVKGWALGAAQTCCSTTWADGTGKHKHREFPRRSQSLQAATSSLWEKRASTLAMLNAITCINKRFAVKNFGISCLVLMFNSSNQTVIIL